MSARRISVLSIALLPLLCLTSPGCDDAGECSEGCACTAEYLCLEGLECLSSYCVVQSPSNASSETAGNATEPGDTGDGSVDNVAACESFAESIECSLPEGILECSAYADVDCDITDYLDCLTDNTSCANGVIDTSGWIECFSLVEDCL